MRDMKGDRGQIWIWDRILAVAVGALTAVVVLVWGVPGIDPSMWDEVAAVAGVRPPYEIFPAIWRSMTRWAFLLFGISGATVILKLLGAAVAGACAALVYLITRQVLAMLIRTQHPYRVWYRRIAPFFSFFSAFLFGIGEPLARTAQIFSPDELRLVMSLLVVHLLLRWFTVGGRWRLFPSMALMGLLAAETPIGILLPFVFACAYAVVWGCVMNGLFRRPEKLPPPSGLPKWRMFFLFLGGMALGVWMNGAMFIELGGAEANGWLTSEVYFRYSIGYWGMFKNSASLAGWVLGFGSCIVPLVVSVRLFPMLVRDDQPMPFARGALMFFIGMLALMQSGAVSTTRFWTFAVAPVYSGFLLSFFNVCAMITAALFGSAFAFECQRTYLSSEADVVEAPPGILLRGLAPAIAVAVMVAALLAVPKPVDTEMQRIVDAAIEETVRECEGMKWLFTDGRLDAAIEIEARRKGKPLRTLNMMSGANRWEVSVRSRGFDPGSPDFKTAETSIPALLRTWAGEKVNGMDGVALQLGFDFWKRERKPLPKASGMVAIEKGLDDATAEQGIRRTKAIADRILAISDRATVAAPSAALASAFSAVNWRISRFARYRNETAVANGLDQANTALRRMLSAIEYERLRTFMQLTPREGLEIALKRANYVEARRYSAVVLQNDEDDPEANFAMGMSAIMDKRYKDAEFYLEKILKRRPKEPAALNNLSIVCRKLHKYKEAEEYARRALDVMPESKEIRSTLKDAVDKAP